MGSKPVTRVGDDAKVSGDAHGCPACPHTCVGPGVQGSPDVFTNSKPTMRKGDAGVHAACCGPNKWNVQKGSGTGVVNGKEITRKGDPTVHCGNTGKTIKGSNNVKAGG